MSALPAAFSASLISWYLSARVSACVSPVIILVSYQCISTSGSFVDILSLSQPPFIASFPFVRQPLSR